MSCDFCENDDDVRECDWCCHEVCPDHRRTLDGDELCAPPAPFQHNGCYKPSVAEVAE